VTGFGPFPGVSDNPTAALALALDGARLGPVPVVGRVLPVQWVEGPRSAIATARAIDAAWVIGFGVAMGRSGVEVETCAVAELVSRPDAAGALPPQLGGPAVVAATIDCARLADALGAGLSSDAGRYVCNAWLHQVTTALPGVGVGFVHVPAEGIAPERALAGLAALIERSPMSGNPRFA
jgi:pyrrolidone-carboxylate peptidase